MAMAGRQPEQGEGSREADSFGGLDHFLRRLDSSDAAEVGAGSGATVSQQQLQASPSNSIAALVSNYDDLSPNPANPWQYLPISNPTSPTSQRERYNHLSAHTSSGGHFQRDQLATEWIMLEELEQQRAVSQPQTAVASRASAMNHQHLQPVPRRSNHPDGTQDQNGGEQSEANFIYEEAAAPAAWYRNGGYLRGPDAASQALYEGLARLDTQASDSAQLASEARMRSWERAMTSQYIAAGEMVLDQPWPSRASPSAGGAEAGGSTRSANSIRTPSNTSQSSGSDGEDSDEEECARFGSASGDGNGSAKRKTPEPSGEGGDNSARTSSEAELKKPAASLPRRRSSFKKPREPRYAIKTRTDVDIMDDGFKWRKYGQKAVKNSPHPRNYYRCTTPQCPVRKRVERSHEDSGLVITTYEGTHTHQTPGFRGPAPHFGECPPRNLFFNPGPLGPVGFAPRFPFPPEYSLAALHQLRALQQAARSRAAQHQIPPGPPFPNAQRESFRLAQQFLGLHDPTFGAVKQEPFYEFMAQLRGAHNLPFPGRNFQPPSGGATFLDRMRQHQMRGPAPPPPPPPPPPLSRHLPPMPDLDYPDFSPDLVRRVLEAEDGDHGPSTDANADNDGSPGQSFASQIQSSLRSRVELERRMSLQRSSTSQPSGSGLLRRRGSSDTLASTSSQRRQPHQARDDDSLVDGLLQEMAQPNASN